jgi:hypothetical protein
MTARRVIAFPFPPTSDDGSLWLSLQNCGRYGDRLVLDVNAAVTTQLTPQLMITDSSGRVLHSVQRPGIPWPAGTIRQEVPEHGFFGGELPRFVPGVSLEGDLQRLVVFDLEEGTIHWRGPAADVARPDGFHVGSRWFLTAGLPSERMLAILDGNTGRFETRTVTDASVTRLRPRQVVGGRIWLYGRDETRVVQPMLAVLEAATLEPVFVRGLTMSSVSRAAKKLFGLQ